MSTKNKTLAKSLHTITVLANVAAFIFEQENGEQSQADCMAAAVQLLGYEGAADPYGLTDKAAASLAAQLGAEG